MAPVFIYFLHSVIVICTPAVLCLDLIQNFFIRIVHGLCKLIHGDGIREIFLTCSVEVVSQFLIDIRCTMPYGAVPR